ncbi:polyphosphate kinase 1 [Prosthecobacter dejongeii]|uniref:Polyphosphate kinase n=1 Tax=Prosthecobacter dejongeii TaxID=48465 RepID=A0A7W8DR61_9BACT|nr:polyphosphate kinase 1 [Prosthecobacter dejongeii]MBB5038945.1 polyphosphate kinase [Prosthecobacter dejongeii]
MTSSSPSLDAKQQAQSPALTDEHFLNRELSWLAFNERVLAEAARAELPVLERVKFLAITASNLDEFFMVRVGALQFLREQGRRVKDPSGLTPTQQWEKIQQRAAAFVARQYEILNQELLPLLREKGIRRLSANELTLAQRTHLESYFHEYIFPVLSPIALDDDKPRISVPALQIALLCNVQSESDGKTTQRLVLFTLPSNLPRHVLVPEVESGLHAYLNLEDLLSLFLHLYFPSEKVTASARFRISRNSDIAVDDESSFDLASQMEDILEARLQSPAIRIEIEDGAPKELVKAIRDLCGAKTAQVYTIPGELDLRAYFVISGLSGFEDLKVEPWDSQSSPQIQPGESMFDAIKRGDILLHHPYETFDPVMQLIEEAAADPDVIAIKQILYRTAKNSRIISALIRAAQAGKHVTVLVELKARFDEARNLERAEDLLNAGAQIIYGVRGLKTHAKICLVMRREAGHLVRYMHFGTGNYNEATSKLYTDISYLTCRQNYGSDASAFFNTVTGRSRFVHFERISMAPFGLRERLLSMIHSETERARQGEEAEIMLKMNALEDRKMITALYEASQAGVKVRLNVRGICCLRPGVKGLSENISVLSIIDRYLEHARIYHFRQGGRPVIFISSADFMNRNLSKRVELLVPVEDKEAKKRLTHILETHFADTSRGRMLKPDGTWAAPAGATGKALRSQEIFAKEASKRIRQRNQAPDVLVPHVPKS